ncbi:MAG: hypothetical protein HC929_24190 [Leptolyngbyaceae cyanobacterium SM2_5_2]|nr:hypothetical protein [Leptolyngbyaceae cyanobacterium SM2_5_2]
MAIGPVTRFLPIPSVGCRSRPRPTFGMAQNPPLGRNAPLHPSNPQ